MTDTKELDKIIGRLHTDNCTTRLAAHHAILMLNEALEALRYDDRDMTKDFIDRAIARLALANNTGK